MKTQSLQQITLVWLASMLFSVNACKDNGNSATNPSDEAQNPPVDEEVILTPLSADDPRTTIPCEGELCYSAADPKTQDAYNDMYQRLAPEIPEDLEDPVQRDFLREQQEKILKRLQFMSDSYSACSYSERGEDIVVAECPQWTTDVRGCPGFFFDFFNHENLPGVIELATEDPKKHLCFYGKRFSGGKAFNCIDGQVRSGALTTRWDDSDSTKPSCFPPELCMQLSEDEKISREDVCFYGDFTTAQTGEITPQDCDTLEPGTCAINCPCGSAAEGPDQGCQFLSEDNPVGICGLGSCYHPEDHNSCPLPTLSCAMPKIPAWVQAAVQQGPMEDAPLGVCVAPSACETWSENNDILDTCGTPAIILPDMP